MAASGVFALILAVAVLKHMQTVLSKQEFKKLFIVGGLVAAGLVFGAVVLLTLCGVSGFFCCAPFGKQITFGLLFFFDST